MRKPHDPRPKRAADVKTAHGILAAQSYVRDSHAHSGGCPPTTSLERRANTVDVTIVRLRHEVGHVRRFARETSTRIRLASERRHRIDFPRETAGRRRRNQSRVNVCTRNVDTNRVSSQNINRESSSPAKPQVSSDEIKPVSRFWSKT